MDMYLGPWKASQAENKPLAAAMGEEAKATMLKAKDWTVKELPKTGVVKSGYTTRGTVKHVGKNGAKTEIILEFIVTVGESLSNVGPISGRGFAEGTNAAEEAVKAITEDRMQKILGLIKDGTLKAYAS